MSDPFIGQITLFAGNFAPRGYAFCDGQLLEIDSNSALFFLLGTIYGGDGRNNFALPDLRSRVPIGFGQGQGLSNRRLGERGGTERVALTTAAVPAHTHAQGTTTLTATLRGHAATDADASVPAPGNVFSRLQSPVTVAAYSDSEANQTLITGPQLSASVGSAGGGAAHENRQPLLALNYIIALTGIFPSEG